jgi:DNA-binding Xre family transcriptional regulator
MRLDFKVLKVLMAQHGIDSIAGLARATGLHRNAIDRLWTGENDPSLATLGAICKVLRCTPNDILILDDEPGRYIPKANALTIPTPTPNLALDTIGSLT